MTNRMQNPVIFTNADHKDWSLYSLEGEAHREAFDRKAGHEYLPMDVFVDPGTLHEHFQASAVRARCAEIQSAAA